MQQTPLISLRAIKKSFGNYTVHKNISMDIFPGEVVTILGPSGTGKTVILKLMIGLLFPTAGTVTVGTHNLATLNEEKLREIRISIGMLFQGAALFDSLSVYENIAFPLKEYGRVPDAEITSIVEEKLSLVDLPETIYKFPPSLSGGQKKRVGLARAMATNPKVLLFDEPTTGLDPTSRDKIDRLIMQLRDKYGITSVVVTHDMESARRISDRLILVHNGIVIAEGQAVSLWGKNHAVDYFATGRWDEYIRETA